VTVREGQSARSGGRESTNRPLGLPRRCYGAGPGGYFNSEARFCCRFAADAAKAQSPLQFVIATGQRARGIEDAPTSAYAAVVLNWTLAGPTPAMRVLSRLDVRPTKKYTFALS
jgi:hypothetical protein